MRTTRDHDQVESETGHGTDLWRVIAAPVVWAIHFLFCYIYGAIYCQKLGRDASLAEPAVVVIGATAVALSLIAYRASASGGYAHAVSPTMTLNSSTIRPRSGTASSATSP